MNQLFRLPGAVTRDPAIEAWGGRHEGELAEVAQRWFAVMRRCGVDVREVLHDDCPTACVGDAAFAYVAVFNAHVNVGFFCGAEIADPRGLLEGTGKLMRHVKIRPGNALDAAALASLITASYVDMKARVQHAKKALANG